MTEQTADAPPPVSPPVTSAPAQATPRADPDSAAPAPTPAAAAVAGERHGFYLGLVSAAFPAILAGVRLFVLSNGDDATLKALAQHTSMQALLIGSYVPFLPLILILAAYLALSERRAAIRGAVFQPTVLASMPPPVALMLLIVGLLTAPVYLLLLLLAAAALLAVLLLRRGRPAPARAGGRPPSPLLGGRVPNRWVDALTLTLGVVLAGMVTLQGMWLPATALTVDGTTRVAYLLGQEDDLETVLYRDGGGPQQLKSDQITARRMCSEREAGLLRRPLAALIFAPDVKTSDVPLCRDLLAPGGSARAPGAPAPR
ncbi:hypothetical protein [Catellatospora vulcania]|uniref:hypothetical protein n=1 Tax=Catellatospora vulcania TaxID=1460450 RepID=UPI0012D38A07|nr:hypothetical protein [Catellatospora vulcania]